MNTAQPLPSTSPQFFTGTIGGHQHPSATIGTSAAAEKLRLTDLLPLASNLS